MSLIVYTAASFRQAHAVRLFHNVLEDEVPGVHILDWTTQATPSSGLTPDERRRWMDTGDGNRVFDFCRSACQNADILIYFGQSGQDAGIQVGIAHGYGTRIIGILGSLEAPGLMLHGAVNWWALDALDAVAALRKMSICFACDPECQYREACPRAEY